MTLAHQLEALRQALVDTEPDSALRAEHANGCFTDNPSQTLCMVCGCPLPVKGGES